MKVTLYAIAKNEENNIQKFIENSKKFSHTVVVDTGSTDNTVSLLRDAGIEVYEHSQTKEEFDFSVARNQALSHVKTDWAFSLDFNENIDDLYLEGFDILQDEFTAFKHLRFDDNGEEEPQQSNEVHVRFHRTQNYKWVNAVHEMPVFISTEEFPQESTVETSIKILKKFISQFQKNYFILIFVKENIKKTQQIGIIFGLSSIIISLLETIKKHLSMVKSILMYQKHTLILLELLLLLNPVSV